MKCVVMTSAIGMLIAATGLSQAQEPDGSGPYGAAASTTTSTSAGAPMRFKSGVSVVSLGVTVTGREQQPRLGREDFAVFEDGRPQALQYFAADAVPLDLAILLDTSASMDVRLHDVQAAALELASALRPGDRASFTEVKRGMRTLQPLSVETKDLVRKIQGTSPGGSTAIYDAIYVALRELTRAASGSEPRRQALVILSDGDDTASLLRYDDVSEAARTYGVTIYAVSLRFRSAVPPSALVYDPKHVHGDFALRTLAAQTGGQAYFNLDGRQLATACRHIADELSAQYMLGYVSNNPRVDGRFRQVSVQVVSTPRAQARTRQGYFAAAASQSSR